MKACVQCLARNSHTRLCHSYPVWTYDQCQHTGWNRKIRWVQQMCVSTHQQYHSQGIQTICSGNLWDLNKPGSGFRERSFSDWFGAKSCHKHLVLSGPQFPTPENEREKMRKRRNEGGRVGGGSEERREERRGQDQHCSNPKGSRKQPQDILVLFLRYSLGSE